MTMQQPEALRLAHLLELDKWPDAAEELRRLHAENQSLQSEAADNARIIGASAETELALRARVEGLERELAAIGAGGVEPLRKRAEAHDLAARLQIESLQSRLDACQKSGNDWAMRVHALENQLSAIGAGGVEPLRKHVAAPQAAVPETREALGKRLIADVKVANAIATVACQRVAELPDRDSPADWPETMLVTGDELHMIVREAAIEAQAAPAHPTEGVPAQAAALLATGGQAQADIASHLYRAIEHGDREHRAWLRSALNAFFKGQPVPQEKSTVPRSQADAQDTDRWMEIGKAIFGDEDHVLVPRGLIGAACYAIENKRDGTKTLAELRRYTTGDLSAATPAAGVVGQEETHVDNLFDAVLNCPHAITAESVTLHFYPKQEGHNALSQLRHRLAAADVSARQRELQLLSEIEALERLALANLKQQEGGA